MNNKNHPISLIGIIVSYNPNSEKLKRLVEILIPQVDAIVIVDNGSNTGFINWFKDQKYNRTTLLALNDNFGIAAAQNIGINWANAQGAKQVLIFDHDSEPSSDFAIQLQTIFLALEKNGEKIAAIGPRFIDNRFIKNKIPSPFSKIKYGQMRGYYPTNGNTIISVDFLIASGCLISMDALKNIGPMTEALFIDYVDIEWCFRARQLGWSLYGVWDVVMKHELGDDVLQILGRAFPIHIPLRHYYAIRNVIWLASRSKLNLKWKIALAYNGLRRFIFYALFMPQRFMRIKLMSLGIYHGICGRMGRL